MRIVSKKEFEHIKNAGAATAAIKIIFGKFWMLNIFSIQLK